jgi:hypothetical protein
MLLMVSGIVVFLVTIGIFWSLLPRGGKRHRWVDTELEPYISIAICAGIALSFTMTLSGVLDLLGSS